MTPEEDPVGPALGPDELDEDELEVGRAVEQPPFVSRYKKLVGAVVAMVVGWVALKFGLDLDEDLAALITGVVTAFLVERLENLDIL